MVRKGILFVISGPSGVGKGTIREALLSQVDNLYLSISATTRQARQGEVEGRDYYFVSKEIFLQMVDNMEFLEYAQVYNNMYGTPRTYVRENLEKGRDVLLEIDIQGAMQVKKNMPEAVFMFIQPPSIEELSQRLSGRGKDSEESINKRLAACEAEMAQVIYYDYAIMNDQLSDAVARVKAVIVAERCRVK